MFFETAGFKKKAARFLTGQPCLKRIEEEFFNREIDLQIFRLSNVYALKNCSDFPSRGSAFGDNAYDTQKAVFQHPNKPFRSSL